MKKHFLILMLMALLPMAGWAQSGNLADKAVTVGKVYYGATALPGVEVEGLTATTHYTVETTKFYTDAACTEATAKPLADLDDLPVSSTKYYIKIEGAGIYAPQVTSGWFVVEKKPLVLTYEANALNREYGDPKVALVRTKFSAATGSSFKAGEDQSNLTLGTLSYTASDERIDGGNPVTFGECFTSDNYAISYDPAYKLTIAQKDLSAEATLSITAAKTTIVYTGKNVTGMYTVKYGDKTLVEGTDWSMDATKNVNTGYHPTITFAGNYKGTKDPVATFAITAAPITVSIDDIEQTYNGADQKDQKANAKFTYSGIVGDDVANAATIKAAFTAPTKVEVASEAKNVGTYTLVLSEDATVGTYTNYKMETYVPGTLTIKKAELKLKAADETKAIGGAEPKYKLTGIPANYEVTGVTFKRDKAGTEEGEKAGEYDITPVISTDTKVMYTTPDPDVDVTANYDLKIDDTKGKLTIGKGKITVILKDTEKPYGDADPDFTVNTEKYYKTVGLAAGDPITVTISRDKSGLTPEAVGTYAMTATVTGIDETKYNSTVEVLDGVFTIARAKLTFAIPAQNIAIGKKATDLKKDGIVVSGVKKTDEDIPALYELSFSGDVSVTGGETDANQNLADGLVATLTAEAQKNYEIDATSTNKVGTGPVYVAASGRLIVGSGSTADIAFTSVDGDYATITAKAGETHKVTLKIDKRTREVPVGTAHSWAAQTWNTMVLPFDVTVAELSAELGYAIVNRVDKEKTTEGNVVFKLEMGTIPANEPFCVKTTNAIADNTVTLTFTGKKIVDGGENPSVEAGGPGYKFVGNYKNKTISKTTPNYYFLRGDNPKWAHITATSDNTWTVCPFDAYIDQTGAASARELTFTFQELDGSYTAIKSIAADKNDEGATKTGWYTIGGMKLQSAPTQKGVYINNGKKIIVK